MKTLNQALGESQGGDYVDYVKRSFSKKKSHMKKEPQRKSGVKCGNCGNRSHKEGEMSLAKGAKCYKCDKRNQYVMFCCRSSCRN